MRTVGSAAKGKKRKRKGARKNPMAHRERLPAGVVAYAEDLERRMRAYQLVSHAAYTRGDHKTAQEWDERAEVVADHLENYLDELELEPAERAEEEPDVPPGIGASQSVRVFGAVVQGGAVWGLPPLAEVFSDTYGDYLRAKESTRPASRFWGAASLDERLAELLRARAREYPGFIEETTDRELVAAAKDAYENRLRIIEIQRTKARLLAPEGYVTANPRAREGWPCRIPAGR